MFEGVFQKFVFPSMCSSPRGKKTLSYVWTVNKWSYVQHPKKGKVGVAWSQKVAAHISEGYFVVMHRLQLVALITKWT